MDTSQEIVIERLLAHRPGNDVAEELEWRAAVTMLLRFGGEGPEVLLLTRAEREGDRWSGQIGLPGGREEEADGTLLATAMRETREEVGLDLERCARPLGRLRPLQAQARGKLLPMMIQPFVFLRTERAPVTLNEEATDHFWFPLVRAASGELSSTCVRPGEGESREFPCWRFEEREIWGLTFRMLNELLRVAFHDEEGERK